MSAFEWVTPTLVRGQRVGAESAQYLQQEELDVSAMTDDTDETLFSYKHGSQCDESDKWQARPLAHANSDSQGQARFNDVSFQFWESATETFLRAERNGSLDIRRKHGVSPPLKLQNPGENLCYINSVLQALMSVLQRVALHPVDLESGRSYLALSLFLCAFPELNIGDNSNVNKDSLIQKLQANGFLQQQVLGEQEDAACFWANMTSSGPLRALAAISVDEFLICGTCDNASHIQSMDNEILIPDSCTATELKAASTEYTIREVLSGIKSMQPRVDRTCEDLNCSGSKATAWRYSMRSQPVCLTMRFQRTQVSQSDNQFSINRVNTAFVPPPRINIADQSHLESAPRSYVLCSVVLQTGTADSGHYSAAVQVHNLSSIASQLQQRCMARWHTCHINDECYLCDDTASSRHRWQHLLAQNSRNTYLAFYVREQDLSADPVLLSTCTGSDLFTRLSMRTIAGNNQPQPYGPLVDAHGHTRCDGCPKGNENLHCSERKCVFDLGPCSVRTPPPAAATTGGSNSCSPNAVRTKKRRLERASWEQDAHHHNPRVPASSHNNDGLHDAKNQQPEEESCDEDDKTQEQVPSAKAPEITLEAALRMLCDSVGHERFEECEALSSGSAEERAAAISSLREQILEEQLTHEQLQRRIVGCSEALKRDCLDRTPCAGCGRLTALADIKVFELAEETLQVLRVPAGEVASMDSKLELMQVCVWPNGEPMFVPNSHPFTTYRSTDDGQQYHLDPTGCNGATAQLCSYCVTACKKQVRYNSRMSTGSYLSLDLENNATGAPKAPEWPSTMIIGGSDFGQPAAIGLDTNLTVAERAVLPLVRVFDCIIKLKPSEQAGVTVDSQLQDALKGHVITMPHDAAERIVTAITTVNSVTHVDMLERLHVMFVGNQHIWAKMKSREAVLSSVRVDAAKMIKWLVALSIFNNDPGYKVLQRQFFPDHGQFDAHSFDIPSSQEHYDAEMCRLIEAATIADEDTATQMEAEAGAPLHDDDGPPPTMAEPDDVEGTGPYVAADDSPRDNLTVPALSHVLWHHQPNQSEDGLSPEERLLQSAARLTGTKVELPVQAQGSAEPLSEFSENARILTGGFPELFFLGKGVAASGSIPNSTVEHWLYHHSMRFERNPQLLFLLFNQLQRHETCRNVAASVSSKPSQVQELTKLLNEPGFVESLEAALDDPASATGKRLVRKLERLMHLSSKQVPFSAMERKAAVSKLYSLVQFFGLPSWFVTVSPSENNSQIVMTVSNRCLWDAKQPGSGVEIDDNGRKCRKGLVEWSTVSDYPARARQVAENPVAAAKYFAALTEAMMEHLCQLSCSHTVRKTSGLSERDAGVLGKTMAHFAALECQGRGSLHFHAVVWSGLSPEFLQALASSDPELQPLRRDVAAVLDTMARAKLDPTRHAERQQDKDLRNEMLRTEGPATFENQFPEAYNAIAEDLNGGCDVGSGHRVSQEELQQFVERYVGNIVNVHSHSKTCHKGKYGQFKCRMAYPCPICDDMEGNTGPVELRVDDEYDADGNLAWHNIEATRVSSTPENIPRQTPSDFLKSPLRHTDPRLIIWELGREGEQGDGNDEYVVPYSVAFSATGMCNTAVVPLGSQEQAKAVCFYLLKYITKDSTALENTRVVLREALKHITKYPSVAEDTGTDERTCKHLLQRLINSVAGAQEISAQMAATALLRKPSCFTSDNFWFAFIWPAIQDIKRQVEKGDLSHEAWAAFDAVHNSSAASQGPTPNAIDATDDVDVVELLPTGDQETMHNDEEGSAGIFHTKDARGQRCRLAIPQHIHYKHRGKELKLLSFYEFVSLIHIVTVKKTTQSNAQSGAKRKGAGRKSNQTFTFATVAGEEHPLATTHIMRLRSKRLIPILAGSPPPLLPRNPAKARVAADKFAAYMMTLFCPWDLESGLPNGGRIQYPDFCNMMHTWTRCQPASTSPDPVTHQLPTMHSLECQLYKMRAFWVHNIARGLRVSTYKKKIMTLYRYSCATEWTDEQKSDAEARGWRRTTTGTDPDVDTIGAMADISFQALHSKSGNTSTSDKDTAEYLQNLRDVLHTIDSLPAEQSDRNQQHTVPGLVTTPLMAPSWDACQHMHCPPGQPNPNNSVLGIDDIIANITTQPQPFNPMSPTDAQDSQHNNTPASQHQDQPSVHRASSEDTTAAADAHIVPLRPKQQLVFDQVVDWHTALLAHRQQPEECQPPPPLLMLVHGPPGTGKTVVADRIAAVLKTCAACAPTGIAASMFVPSIQAKTIHGTVGIPAEIKDAMRPLSTEQLTNYRNQLLDKDILLLDEISFVDPVTLARINQRLQEIKQVKTPFGGMGVVLFGDFFQLEPASFGMLCKSVVKFQDGELRPEGCHSTNIIAATHLFATCRKYELTEQMRSRDPQHTKWLMHFRDNSQLDASPISQELIDDYPDLSRADLESDDGVMHDLNERARRTSLITDPIARERADQELRLHTILAKQDLWSMAPIAVAGNQVRHTINSFRIRTYASRTDQPVLYWHNPLHGANGQVLQDDDHSVELNWLRGKHPELTTVFAKGAPGHLLVNLNPAKQLANGTPVVMHSISFASAADDSLVREKIQEWERTGRLPGAMIQVPVPVVVNVQVPSVLATPDNVDQRIGVADCAVNKGLNPSGDPIHELGECVVIPVPYRDLLPCAGAGRYACVSLPRAVPQTTVHGLSSKAKNSVNHIKIYYRTHPVIVSFALTYHKLQGQTVRKLIADLNATPAALARLTLRHIYVGLSRVRTRASFRKLSHVRSRGAIDPSKRYKHLLSKKRDAVLARYLQGFDHDGSRYVAPPKARGRGVNVPAAAPTTIVDRTEFDFLRSIGFVGNSANIFQQ